MKPFVLTNCTYNSKKNIRSDSREAIIDGKKLHFGKPTTNGSTGNKPNKVNERSGAAAIKKQLADIILEKFKMIIIF